MPVTIISSMKRATPGKFSYHGNYTALKVDGAGRNTETQAVTKETERRVDKAQFPGIVIEFMLEICVGEVNSRINVTAL